ncbi:Predicted arabinose efflux permease, MFS family [Streptomyces sp. OV198]|nr:MFS transporter [Streptomyces sp. OV198]SOE74616.1 Predicted arabinose efflux permease, MFS family [Streptomyces sp. OV198]
MTAEGRYRVLVTGYSVSSYGTFLNMVALNLFVYATTHSALAIGLFMAVRLGAGFLAGTVAGRVQARFGVKPVMLWANIAQAVVMFLLVVTPDGGLRTGVLFTVSAAVGACSTVFMVALRSSIPDLVGADRRAWANSLMVGGRSLAMVAGFASSGVVVPWLGFTAAFLVDAASFLVCAAAVAWLPGVERAPEPPRAPDEPREKRGVWAATTALATVPALGLMMCLRTVDALGSSSHNAALPIYSSTLHPDDPAAFVSRFWLFWALGNVLAQQVIQRWAKRSGRAVGALGFGLGTIVMSSAFILGFAGFPMAATVLIALVAGAADGLTEVSYTSHLQTLPETLRGHAFGLTATVENLGFGIGMIGVSAALESFSAFTVVAWSHGLAIVVAGIYLLRLYAVHGAGKEGTSGAYGSRRDGAEVSGS